MYLSTDVLTPARDAASQFIMDNDRALYGAFYSAVETFCVANSIMIGGQIGIALLLGQPLTPLSPPWDLYLADTNSFDVAKRLTVALSAVHSPHVPTRTVVLRTDLKHAEYTISVAARQLLKLYALANYRGVELGKLIQPRSVRGYFGATVSVLPEEIQLMEIYRDLYLPNKADQWPELLRVEAALAGMRVGGKGGRSATPIAFARSFDMIKHLAPDDVLIGDYAAARLLNTTPSASARVQFISAVSPDDICASLNRAVGSSTPGVRFTHAKLALNISDWQLRKHTIYATVGRDQAPVADVFNASAHEMIPVIRGGPRDPLVAGVYVLLRFSMIDIWSLRMIEAMSGKKLGARIDEIKGRCERLRSLADGDPTLRNPRDYVGIYVDEIVAKRQFIRNQGVNFPPFYPSRIAGAGDHGVHSHAGISSRAIDFALDPDTKQQILRKVTGLAAVSNEPTDMIARLTAWRARQSRAGTSERSWGIGKTLPAYYHKNAMFLRWIPREIGTYVDIGCGDGLDVVALAQRYRIRAATCADIDDHRADAAKRRSNYLRVELGRPLDIADATADLVAVFHSLHHMRDNVAERLADIVRITRSGGLIFIKDHDVSGERADIIASNVDFEHLAYLVAEPAWSDRSVEDLASDFAAVEPMTYWPADYIDELMSERCERLDRRVINTRTNVYGAVYRKRS